MNESLLAWQSVIIAAVVLPCATAILVMILRGRQRVQVARAQADTAVQTALGELVAAGSEAQRRTADEITALRAQLAELAESVATIERLIREVG